MTTVKVFTFTNDTNISFQFLYLCDTMEKLALCAYLPENLSDIIYTDGKWNADLNLGNIFVDELMLNPHLLVFKDFILSFKKFYKKTHHRVCKACPYCKNKFELLLFDNEVISLMHPGEIEFLNNNDNIQCTFCYRSINIVHYYEYLGIKCASIKCLFCYSKNFGWNLRAVTKYQFEAYQQAMCQCTVFDRCDTCNSPHIDPYFYTYDCSKQLIICGDVELNPGPEMSAQSLETIKDFIISLPNIVSYDEVMSKLKPVSTITGLYQIYKANDVGDVIAEVVRLLETHNLFWTFSSDKLVVCVDVILTLIKGIPDVPDLIKSFVSGEDRLSVPPEVMESQSIELCEDGILNKVLKFTRTFGIAEETVRECGPILALIMSVVASIGLIACGNKLTNISQGFSSTLHSMATDIKDYRVIMLTFKDTWSTVISYLGKFLGFTYLDDKQVLRKDFILKIDDLTKRIEELERGTADFVSLADPMYYEKFFDEIKKLDKIIIAICQSDTNLTSLRLKLNELMDKVKVIKDNYLSVVSTLCGKQQPTTIYVYSAESGIGKTSFNVWAIQEMGLSYYSRNAQSKHWNNYVYQDAVQYADFNQDKEDLDHKEIDQIYSPNAYEVEMADIASKGRQFKSRYMFLDSNVGFVHSSQGIKDPSILDRRRDFFYEAMTTYTPTPVNPKPTKDECLQYLVLRSECKIRTENLPLEIRGRFVSEFYTLDGRDFEYGGVVHKTQLFSTLLLNFSEHESAQRIEYKAKCKAKFDKYRIDKMQSQAPTDCPVRIAESSNRPIIVLMGPPGCGKTHLASQFRQDSKQDEFPIRLFNADQRIIDSYDTGEEYLLLTCNTVDYVAWKNHILTKEYGDERWARIERRIKIVHFSYKRKFLYQYYTAKDICENPSDYTKMVDIHYNKLRIPYVDLIDMIQTNKEMQVVKTMMYQSTPRLNIKRDDVKNLIELDIAWQDADELSTLTTVQLMRKVNIVRSEFNFFELMKAFSAIVRDVFSQYIIKQNLEQGLKQLNSLRVSSPLNFDCVFKFRDEVFFLTTDPEGKIVFCICDEAFEYKVEDNKVMCYSEQELMWEVTGPLSDWYTHILRNVDKITFDYTNITPPSSKFNTYCNHFLNFAKSITAAYAIFKLCVPKQQEMPSEMYSDYDQSFRGKPITLTGVQDETSADVAQRTRMQVKKSGKMKGTWKVKSGFSRKEDLNNIFDQSIFQNSETSADVAQRTRMQVQKSSKSRGNWKVKTGYSRKGNVDSHSKYLDDEAAADVSAIHLANIAMDQNYPVINNQNQRVCFALGVFKNYVLTVGHIADNVLIEIDKKQYQTRVIQVDGERDLAVLEVLNLPMSFRDIRKHFQPERVDITMTGQAATLYTRSENGRSVFEKPIIIQEQCTRITTTGEKNGFLYKVNSLNYVSPIQTIAGYCGSPLIVNNPKIRHKLLGLHIAADEVQGLSSIVYQTDFDFEKDVEHLVSEVMTSQVLVSLDFQQVILDEEPLSDLFSPHLKRVGRPGILVDGQLKYNQIHTSDQTQIWPSPFGTDEDLFEPAVLSEKDPRIEIPIPDITIAGINKFGRVQKDLDLDILDECYHELASKLSKIIKSTGYQVKVLSDLEVINGCSMYSSSPSINMASGCGYPHNFEFKDNQRKANMFVFDNVKLRYEFANNQNGEKLREDYTSYLDWLKNGNGRSCVVFSAQKKDECRKLEKIVKASTRVFEMGPLYHFMAMKKYYGAAQAMFTMTNGMSPFKIGINASSFEFKCLYRYLSQTGEIGVDCDYEQFDSSHPYQCLIRNPIVYNTIYKENDPNWTKEDDFMRIRLTEQESKPLVMLKDQGIDIIVECPGGNMSGGEDTGPKNEIQNCVNMRYAWKKLAKIHAPTLYYKYDEYTTDAVFGDDINKTIAEDVLSWYNPQSIADELSKMGFKLTSANKEDALSTKPLIELSFLKRNYKKIEISIGGVLQEHLVGALEDDVFVKMLNWCKTTKRYKYRRGTRVHFDRESIHLTALTCLSEASLKGEEFFNEVKQHIIDCAEYYDILLPDLPHFKQAFFETYFCSTFPEQKEYNNILIKSDDPLSITFNKQFKMGVMKFWNPLQAYEYTRAVIHQRHDIATQIMQGGNLKSLTRAYVENVAFNRDKLMRKIIKCRFGDEDITMTENDFFVMMYPHEYFGYITPSNCPNNYGRLLTEYVKNIKNVPNPKENNNNYNINNTFITESASYRKRKYNKNLTYNQNLIFKEVDNNKKIIQTYLLQPNLETWKVLD
jgi:hypothetical protein